MRRILALGFLVFAAACTNEGPSSLTSPANNVGGVTTQVQPHGAGLQIAATCTPALTITEGNLFPGGLTEFAVTSGSGTVTIDGNNSGTGLQSLTLDGAPTNAVVVIPAFTPGTKDPVVVTFTVINPNLPAVFNLRAASTFHAANISATCPAAPTGIVANHR